MTEGQHLTWRILGTATAALLIAALAWFGNYMVGKVDTLDDKLQAQTLRLAEQTAAIEGLTRMMNAQSDYYIRVIAGFESIARRDREDLREEIRSALAARGVGR